MPKNFQHKLTMQLILLCLGLLLLGNEARGQEWQGPFSDTFITNPDLVIDREDNIHLFYFDLISHQPNWGDCFHIKYSPTGEVLIPPHRLTFEEMGACETYNISVQNYPFIDMVFREGRWLKAFRFDYAGNTIEAPHNIYHLPQNLGISNGCTVSLDHLNRYHIFYSNSTLNPPPYVFYARVSREGELEIGPDTLVSGEPYFHVRFSSVVTSDNRFLGCYSNVDGADQYMQAVLINSDGSIIRPPFNPLPDTSHVSGCEGALQINNLDEMVMRYSSNPIDPNDNGRHELYKFDSEFNFVDCTLVYTGVNAEDNAWGANSWDSDDMNRILMTFETGVRNNQGDWQKRAFTWTYDFDLNFIGDSAYLPTNMLEQYEDIYTVSGIASEAIWMIAKPYTSPYDSLYRWVRVINADCLAVAEQLLTPLNPYYEISLWPNPSNGVSTFSLVAPHQTSLQLSLYNILGQNLRTIVIPISAGRKEVSLTELLSQTASGTYFLNYQIGNAQGVKTITLQK